jgi:hypothetical protein
MLKRIYVIDVEDVGYRDRVSFGMNADNYDVWSTLLDSSGFQPYSVDIKAAFVLQGIAYHWQFYAPTAAHAVAISPLLGRVRGFDGPTVGNRDFATLLGGRWVPVDPESNAPPLVNFEAVHQALVLQSIIDAPHQTDHARDKIPDRTKLLMAWIAQAADKNGFDTHELTPSLTTLLMSMLAIKRKKTMRNPSGGRFATPTTSRFLIGGGLG